MKTATNTIKLTSRELSNLPKTDFKKYVEEVLASKLTAKINKLSLRFPYALNCKFEEKVADQHKVYRYTVFINNAGTIAHILDANCEDALIRIRLNPSIKHLNKKRQMMVIYHRVKHIIDIDEPIF